MTATVVIWLMSSFFPFIMYSEDWQGKALRLDRCYISSEKERAHQPVVWLFYLQVVFFLDEIHMKVVLYWI